MRYHVLVFAVFVSISICQNVHAQTAVETPLPIEVATAAGGILVIGDNSSFILKGKNLENMVEAFENGMTEFAPSARLMFQVAAEEGQSLDDISLSLKIDDKFTDITVDENNLFALPVIPKKSKKVKLIVNRSKKAIKIRPLVYSTVFAPSERRLGDLRLECRVLWAGSTRSILSQAIFGAAGGCDASTIGFYFPAPNPLKALLVNGEDFVADGAIRHDGKSYRPPIYDKKIGNDAVLTLTALN